MPIVFSRQEFPARYRDLSGISDVDFLQANPTPIPCWTQRICRHGVGIPDATKLLVGSGAETMLFSRWTLAVRERERHALAYFPDSHLPAGQSVVLHLSRGEKGGGRVAFPARLAGCNSIGDQVGPRERGILRHVCDPHALGRGGRGIR